GVGRPRPDRPVQRLQLQPAPHWSQPRKRVGKVPGLFPVSLGASFLSLTMSPCRGDTAGLGEPGRTDPPAARAKGARDRWLVALEIHGTRLQRGEMVNVENRQLVVHNAVNRRIELQSLLLISSLPRFRNEFIGFFVFE